MAWPYSSRLYCFKSLLKGRFSAMSGAFLFLKRPALLSGANCWSLIAGIPTKILNAVIYGMLLPRDIPAFFARYPLAVAVGALLYFIVTVLVEFICAVRWRRRSEASIAQRSLWNGILLANLATYTVLAPLYYYATRPIHDVREFAHDARWSRHPDTEVVFTDSENEHLKMT